MMNALCQDRSGAGLALAEMLGKYAGLGTVVLALDRGGTMIAAEIARGLGAPFDLLPVQSFVLPCEQRTLLGAVGPDGICVLDDEVVDLLDIETDAVTTLRCQANAELAQRNHLLRGDRPWPRINGRTVLLVDDVVASTLSVRAAILYLRQHDPRRVVVVAPIVTQAAAHLLRLLVDDVVAIETCERVPSLERVYARAAAPSDTDVRRVLGVDEPLPGLLCEATADD
jgi:putative phosphoribosyl transferase